ncbi:hypothetical protein EVA_15956, partial [gut metagenome]
KNTGLDHRLDEDEPFSYYIDKVYYALYRIGETKPFCVQHLYAPEEEEKVHTVEFPQDLPFGSYAMVVWANIDEETGLEDAGASDTYRLHGEHWEGYDVYMACDTLHYNERQANFLLPLERVKGKLLITAEGMPETIQLSYKEVDNLYQEVDHFWQYSGKEKVRTLHRWGNGMRNLFTDTYLAPTLEHQQSEVRVHFVQDEESDLPLLDPATVQTNMKRNSITVLRYVYDKEDHNFDIYL